MMETIFRNSQFLVLIAVFVCAVSAVLLYSAAINIVFNVIMDFVRNVPASADSGMGLAVRLLKILDLLLIAITFHIMAVSLYRLFITPSSIGESRFLSTLNIHTFHDLKITLIQVAVVIMVILFLEDAVRIGASLETLYFGLAVSLVTLAAAYAWKSMGK